MNIWIFLLKSNEINLKPPQSINIHTSSLKSPANMEITWGHCPRVPKENGGLVRRYFQYRKAKLN